MNRTILLSAGALVTLASCKDASLKRETPPNILIIIADDLGYSDLGCFGGDIPTPNIDRLAAEGMRMLNFYTCPVSAPTRASLMTGLYSTRAGVGRMGLRTEVPEYSEHIRDDCTTIAENLKTNGYLTYMAGKWHLGSQNGERPAQRGFDRSYSVLAGAGDYYRPSTLHVDDKPVKPDDLDPDYYITRQLTDHAVNYIKEAGDNPFFLYLAYTAPHWPLQAPKAEVDKYIDFYMQGWDVLRQTRFAQQKSMGFISPQAMLPPRDERVPAWDSMTDTDKRSWAQKMAVYAAMVNIVDQGIGKVLKQLEEQHILDNTIILFLSDNGGCPWKSASYVKDTPADADAQTPGSSIYYDFHWAQVSATPNFSYKRFAYNGGVNVPFIVRYPREVKAGTVSTVQAHVIDILPTCLDYTGTELLATFRGNQTRQNLDGVSLKNVFAGSDKPVHDIIAWEHNGERGLLKGNWKIVWNRADRIEAWQLFDLTKDGGVELNDLSRNYPEKLNELVQEYDAWAKRNKVLTPEEVQKLPRLKSDASE